MSPREHLRASLQGHGPVDGKERDDLERILALLALTADPWDRRRYRPGHLTASALVAHPSEAKIALVHHGKLGLWLQPGGHAEPGEDDPAEIARREAREEIGVDVDPAGEGILDVDVHDIPARPGEPAHRHFDLRLAFRAASGDIRHGPESRAIRWASLEELEALGCDGGLRRAAAKLLRPGRAPGTRGA